MKILLQVTSALILCMVLYSCKKDSPIKCESDPRQTALGVYMMEDSVFFLDSYNSMAEYELTIQLDSLEGDTILLENCFDFSINLKAIYESSTGDFVIFPQPDQDAMVSGTGNISNNEIDYTASYSDGGYSFIGQGIKN